MQLHIKSVQLEAIRDGLGKLSPELKQSANEAIKALLDYPQPSWIRLEKLSGYKKPGIYTIHLTRNHSHKASFEYVGDRAVFRRIGTHKQIDKTP